MMALILSIPTNVSAEDTYYTIDPLSDLSMSLSVGSKYIPFNFVYEDPNELQYPVPEGTQISEEAFQYVVDGFQNGNVTLFAVQGYAINRLVSDTFSLVFNSIIQTGNIINQFVITPHTISYYLDHWDGSNVPANEKKYYWVFNYLGCSIEIALTPGGDFNYVEVDGKSRVTSNYRHSSPLDNAIQKAAEEQTDANSHKLLTPYYKLSALENLDDPYIVGKSLYFKYYVGNVSHLIMVDDFTDTSISIELNEQGNGTSRLQLSLISPSHYHRVYYDNSELSRTTSNTRATIDNENIVLNNQYIDRTQVYLSAYNYDSKSFKLPFYFGNWNAIYTYNRIGCLSNSFVAGFDNIYLSSIDYSPIPVGSRPNLPYEVPTDVVIEYPDTELPEVPDGTPENPEPLDPEDPIPINPVNPTPPVIRPLPSIISGNDDLWPSVVELQDIEIDLSGYLSSLGDYSFPDLSVITESFAGSIVWVSTLMSTLFNGSDFSILFAVLSSFFIVAALLGLYKWWNHK